MWCCDNQRKGCPAWPTSTSTSTSTATSTAPITTTTTTIAGALAHVNPLANIHLPQLYDMENHVADHFHTLENSGAFSSLWTSAGCLLALIALVGAGFVGLRFTQRPQQGASREEMRDLVIATPAEMDA